MVYTLFTMLLLTQWSPLQTDFGRELVFSADLCYNGTNEKPRPLGEVAAKPTERERCAPRTLSPAIAGALPQGEPLEACIFRGMGFARCQRCLQRCNTKAKLAIKGERYVCVKEKENTTISKSKNRER